MKVAVIGMGHVGRGCAELFGRFAPVVTYDVADGSAYPARELASCDLAFVCVGTPARADGSCDTDAVFEAVAQLPTERIVLRSTVVPGTTDRLIAETAKAICYSPEFISESDFESRFGKNASDMDFMIVGGEPTLRREIIGRLTRVLGPERTYFQCSASEAELIKYTDNAFLATKVTFVNEIYELCCAFGVDWLTVREGWLLDPRVGRSHSAVFEDERGFDGRCLPKDLSAIIQASLGAAYDPQLLRQVQRSNELFRRMSRHRPAPAAADEA